MELLYGTIFTSALVLAAVLGFLFFKKREKEKILGSFDMSLFRVTMPKYRLKKEEVSEKDEKAVIGQMEQVLSNFLHLKKPGLFNSLFSGLPRIALEISSQIGGTDISFYTAVPSYLESALEKYIQGIYPRASVEKVPQDYTIFEPAGVTAGAYLKLKETALFPINTYRNLEKDPLSSITNSLSKIAPDEGAALQIIIKPSAKSLKHIGEKALSRIREGGNVSKAIAESFRSPLASALAEVFKIFSSLEKNKKYDSVAEDIRKKQLNIDENVIKAIQDKIQKPVFDVNIRAVSSASTVERAKEILNHLEGAFSQFSLFVNNGFVFRETEGRHLKRLIYDFSFRNFNPGQEAILNVEELTSIYHFPTHFSEIPYVKGLRSGDAAPPFDLPEKGLNLIGRVVFRGEEKKVCFAGREDRRRHFYIIGQTGTGKSGLLSEAIRQDMEKGEGIAVIDPHGDLVEKTLANVPAERIEDVVLFEPFDVERPVGLNMLEYKTPGQKDFAVQEMISIFHKLFPPEIIGPMFEHYMRNAMLTIMSDSGRPGTLVEIPRMFTDQSFMEHKLQKVTDPLVRSFWLKEWKQTTGATKSDMLGYVVSKVGRFIENEMMRNIIGQSHSGFDLGKIMDEGKIFLANLSKGMTGEVNASLLGLILVSKMQMASMRRSQVPEKDRRDFYLYIDEFQNFTTDSIATILSEARKYRLNLILAHQYIPQLTDVIRDAVLGNAGTIAAFRVGADDAEFLEKQFEPEFSRFDLVNLDNYNLVIKMMIKGKMSEPFRMQTFPPKEGNTQAVGKIRETSRLKYGKAKEEVEAEILENSKLGLIES